MNKLLLFQNLQSFNSQPIKYNTKKNPNFKHQKVSFYNRSAAHNTEKKSCIESHFFSILKYDHTYPQ